MNELQNFVGSMEYDGLITGLNPPVRRDGGILAKLSEAAVYKRGTLLAKSDQDGLLYIHDGTHSPHSILVEDTEVGTEEDVPVLTYEAGCFDPEKITVAEGYELTDADRDKLRSYNIVFKAASPGL